MTCFLLSAPDLRDGACSDSSSGETVAELPQAHNLEPLFSLARCWPRRPKWRRDPGHNSQMTPLLQQRRDPGHNHTSPHGHLLQYCRPDHDQPKLGQFSSAESESESRVPRRPSGKTSLR
mmetsp:Transcript_15834/g.27281  ORF Transcript_15834/g.27281 Transcript_15834/m.27281 type:complete len:120 (+) Transcript_15834:527-886(+)